MIPLISSRIISLDYTQSNANTQNTRDWVTAIKSINIEDMPLLSVKSIAIKVEFLDSKWYEYY